MGKITGQGQVLYWGIETQSGVNTLLNGGVPFRNSDLNQPFNPIEGEIPLPYPEYEQEMVYTSDSLEANINLSYTKELKPGEASWPNAKGMIYHDPMFMMANVFTKKVISGTWAGGAGTYGKITGSFLSNSHVDTIMFQYKKIDDSAVTQFEKTLHGIVADEFRIGFDKGNVLRTKYALKTCKQANNTRGYSAEANFDDGRWADWAKSTFYPATGCKVYWDNSHAAEFVDINVYNAWLIFKIPKKYNVESSSLVPYEVHHENRVFTAEITGSVKGDTELDELDSLLSAKTKKDLRLQWDLTTNENKFIDITNAFVNKIDSRKIPSASAKYEATITLKGITADYEGNFNNLADPDTKITDG